MEKFFHLKENGTTVSTEILAGLPDSTCKCNGWFRVGLF